jgi:hypothetical protein
MFNKNEEKELSTAVDNVAEFMHPDDKPKQQKFVIYLTHSHCI